MSKEEVNVQEKKRNDLDDIIGLLRLRLIGAIQDEVNSCGETVAKILDCAFSEVSSKVMKILNYEKIYRHILGVLGVLNFSKWEFRLILFPQQSVTYYWWNIDHVIRPSSTSRTFRVVLTVHQSFVLKTDEKYAIIIKSNAIF